MSDFGESYPIPEQMPSYSTKNELSFSQDLKLEMLSSNALDIAWAKGISGKNVDFPKENGKKSQAMEIDIPLRFEAIKGIYQELITNLANKASIPLSQEELAKKIQKYEQSTWFQYYGVPLPENIKRIKILDAAPQEVLPKSQRTIDSERRWFQISHSIELTNQPSNNSITDKLLHSFGLVGTSTMRRKRELTMLFEELFPNKTDFMQFSDQLKKSGASEILLVHGHGRDGDVTGEQSWEVSGPDARWQEPGNRINFSEILDMYDQPEKFGAILIDTCYVDDKKPPVKRIPVYRQSGVSGLGGHPLTSHKLLVSMPENYDSDSKNNS